MENKNNLGALLPINENGGKRAVNARDLHSFLESKQDFSTWMKNRIDQYGFVENQDFQILAPQNYGASWGGSNKVEYALSINMAKELSMVERNEKGRQARQYFIACEGELKEAINRGYVISTSTQPKSVPLKDKLMWVKEVSKIMRLNEASKLGMLQQIAEPFNLPVPDYAPSKGFLASATELIERNGLKGKITAEKLNNLLREKGYVEKRTRPSKKGAKNFHALTEKGLKWGENQVSPHNQKETQIQYYEDKFPKLLHELGLIQRED